MGLDMYLYAGKDADGDENEVGYWRKANAIHKWFTDTCNNGDENNCELIKVSLENLHVLRATVVGVLDGNLKPEEALPTEDGFFFGPTEYGEWYYDDLCKTIEIIDDAIATGCQEFEYMAWW